MEYSVNLSCNINVRSHFLTNQLLKEWKEENKENKFFKDIFAICSGFTWLPDIFRARKVLLCNVF